MKYINKLGLIGIIVIASSNRTEVWWMQTIMFLLMVVSMGAFLWGKE